MPMSVIWRAAVVNKGGSISWSPPMYSTKSPGTLPWFLPG
jgi:hypothetical protein